MSLKTVNNCIIHYTIAYLDTRGLSDQQVEELYDWATCGPDTDSKDARTREFAPWEWHPTQKRFCARLERASPAWRAEEVRKWVADLENQVLAYASRDGVLASDLRDHFQRFAVVECSFDDRTGERAVHRYSLPKLWDESSDCFGSVFTFRKRMPDGSIAYGQHGQYEQMRNTY